MTHTKKSRSAFDGYNRGLQWAKTCAEVAKLKLARVRDPHDNVIALPMAAVAGGRKDMTPTASLGAVLVQSKKNAEMSATSGLRRRASNLPETMPNDQESRGLAVVSGG